MCLKPNVHIFRKNENRQIQGIRKEIVWDSSAGLIAKPGSRSWTIREERYMRLFRKNSEEDILKKTITTDMGDLEERIYMIL